MTVSSRPSPIFDVAVETAPPADLLRQIVAWAEQRAHKRVSYVNAHVINQSFDIPALRQSLLAADLVYCDGYGVRLAAKAIGLPVPHRMTGADWIWGVVALCEEKGRSIYLLGSEPSRYTDCPAEVHRAASPQIQSAPVMRCGTGASSARAASRTP